MTEELSLGPDENWADGPRPGLDYSGEPIKPGEFRDPPFAHRELLDMLSRFLVPEACINGTQMVPLHQDTIREIVEALEELQAISGNPCR